jgi:hypothetical protein
MNTTQFLASVAISFIGTGLQAAQTPPASACWYRATPMR